MKYIKLTKEEQKTLKDFSTGKLKKVASAKKEATRYQKYARDVLNKSKNINIRLSNKDLQKLRAVAAEKGIPYQTLVSSVLHQYSTGRIRTDV